MSFKSTTYLRACYWQILIRKEVKDRTAFIMLRHGNTIDSPNGFWHPECSGYVSERLIDKLPVNFSSCLFEWHDLDIVHILETTWSPATYFSKAQGSSPLIEQKEMSFLLCIDQLPWPNLLTQRHLSWPRKSASNSKHSIPMHNETPYIFCTDLFLTSEIFNTFSWSFRSLTQLTKK